MVILTAAMLADRLRWPLDLTAADVHALAAIFFTAHVRGRLSAEDYARTIGVLYAAEHRLGDQWASLRSVAA